MERPAGRPDRPQRVSPGSLGSWRGRVDFDNKIIKILLIKVLIIKTLLIKDFDKSLIIKFIIKQHHGALALGEALEARLLGRGRYELYA